MNWSLLISGISLIVSIAAFSMSAVMMPKSKWHVQIGDASDFNGVGRMRIDIINESDSPMFGVTVTSNRPYHGSHNEPDSAHIAKLEGGKTISVWVKAEAIRHDQQFPIYTEFIRDDDLVVSLEWSQRPFLSWTRHRVYPNRKIEKGCNVS